MALPTETCYKCGARFVGPFHICGSSTTYTSGGTGGTLSSDKYTTDPLPFSSGLSYTKCPHCGDAYRSDVPHYCAATMTRSCPPPEDLNGELIPLREVVTKARDYVYDALWARCDDIEHRCDSIDAKLEALTNTLAELLEVLKQR